MIVHRITIALALGVVLTACAAQTPPRTPAAAGKERVSVSPYGAYLAARHAQVVRDTSQAADLYARALAFSPDDPELLRRTFSVMATEGRIDEAALLAERLKAQQINIQLATLVHAMHMAKTGQYARAEAELATLPDSGFNSFITPLLRAWLQAARGETGAALQTLVPNEETRGFDAFFDFHAALILDLAGDTEAAGRRYEQLLEKNTGSFIRAVQAVASFYARNGEMERARDIYRSFEADHPGSGLGRVGMAEISAGVSTERLVGTHHEGMAEALFHLASLLHQQNLDEVAQVLARIALHLRPSFDIAELLIADVMEGSGQREKAVAIYESLPRQSPFGWPARLRAAAVLDDSGRTDEAIARLAGMADEQPQRVDALVAMGDILRSRERFAEAVTAYDRALSRVSKLEQHHWSLLYARGISLERTKQWNRAEGDFLKALEFNPDQPYVLNYLGYSWVERGLHLDQALQLIEKAVKLQPEDGYIVDSMGWVLYRLGNYDDAVRNLERAAELRPQDPVINDHLGDAYWRVGRQMEARFQWRRALTLKPEDELVRAIEAKLVGGLSDEQRGRAGAQETIATPNASAGRGI